MRRAIIAAGLVLVALAAAREARAGGFLIYEHSALATGMADARTALWDDPSSMFYNPAAITELDGFQISLGDTLIFPSVKYTPLLGECSTGSPSWDERCGLSEEGRFKVFTPLHAYFTAEITNYLSAGVGVNNPFGLGTFWPEDWDGRYVAWETDLKTFFFQPAVALDIARLAHLRNDVALSFAVTGYYVFGHAMINQKVDYGVDLDGAELFPERLFPGVQSTMKMEGTAHSGGYGFALFTAWKPWISFGASVRSNVPLDFSGTAGFSIAEEDRGELWARQLELFELIPEETGGSTTIELPWNMNFGLAFHGLKKWTFALDLFVALWQSYDELKVHFDCSALPPTDPDYCSSNLNAGAVYPKKWHTGIQLAFGTEYRPVEFLAFRAGIGLVTDPSNPDYYDAMLPDGNRLLVTLGVGYRAPRFFKVDLGYMLAYWKGLKNNDVGPADPGQRNGLVNGHYRTVAHLLGLTVGLSFGGLYKGAPQTLDPRPEPERPAVLPAPVPEPIVPEAPPAAVSI